MFYGELLVHNSWLINNLDVFETSGTNEQARENLNDNLVMKIIDTTLLDKVSTQAKESHRLRMDYNFHQSLDDKCQTDGSWFMING